LDGKNDAEKIAASPEERGVYGEKITFIVQSPFDQNKSIMPAFLRQKILDDLLEPESFRVRELYALAPTEHKGEKCYYIFFRFTARNGFGGLTPYKCKAWVRMERIDGALVDRTIDLEIKEMRR
jgi:hypothetical protein